MKKIINDAGLSCPSCHFGFEELTDHLMNALNGLNKWVFCEGFLKH
jgi:hypothetical protein